MTTLAEIEALIDRSGAAHSGAGAGEDVVAAAGGHVRCAELVLEAWVEARGLEPTAASKEGFRLLALHAQGARGEPSFNACRETCRELAWHYNLVLAGPRHAETPRRLTMMRFLVRHLLLFVSGKMQAAGLGEFCCAAKPLREG